MPILWHQAGRWNASQQQPHFRMGRILFKIGIVAQLPSAMQMCLAVLHGQSTTAAEPDGKTA